jgi:hypothetical protein
VYCSLLADLSKISACDPLSLYRGATIYLVLRILSSFLFCIQWDWFCSVVLRTHSRPLVCRADDENKADPICWVNSTTQKSIRNRLLRVIEKMWIVLFSTSLSLTIGRFLSPEPVLSVNVWKYSPISFFILTLTHNDELVLFTIRKLVTYKFLTNPCFCTVKDWPEGLTAISGLARNLFLTCMHNLSYKSITKCQIWTFQYKSRHCCHTVHC